MPCVGEEVKTLFFTWGHPLKTSATIKDLSQKFTFSLLLPTSFSLSMSCINYSGVSWLLPSWKNCKETRIPIAKFLEAMRMKSQLASNIHLESWPTSFRSIDNPVNCEGQPDTEYTLNCLNMFYSLREKTIFKYLQANTSIKAIITYYHL